MRYRKKLFLMVTIFLTILLLSSIMVQANFDLDGGGKGDLGDGAVIPVVVPDGSSSSSSPSSSGGSSQPLDNPQLCISIKSSLRNLGVENAFVNIHVYSEGLPIENAKIVPWGTEYTCYTDADGMVTIRAPNVDIKTYYSVTAEREGYVKVTDSFIVYNTEQTRSGARDYIGDGEPIFY